MRINVYSQELDLFRTSESVKKTGTNNIGQEETFYGVRFFLVSPDVIHQTPTDDDQSAITFWLPRSGTNQHNLAEHFRYMAYIIDSGLE